MTAAATTETTPMPTATHNIDTSKKNKNIQQYQLDQKYPFTESQLTFLLQLHYYLCHPSCKNNSSSSILSLAASDANNYNDDDNQKAHSYSYPYPYTNALKWIDTHLLLPYYSESFLLNLVQCAIQHSHVFLQSKSNHNFYRDQNDNNDNDGLKNDEEITMNLFLEAMSGLTGRTGGPSFEIKVLYEFILKRSKGRDIYENANKHQSDDDDDGEYKDEKEGSFLGNENGFNIMQSDTFDMDQTVDIEEMIGLLYRLALSCHILQYWSITDERNVETQVKIGVNRDNDETNCCGNGTDTYKGSSTYTSKLDLDRIRLLGTIPPKNMIDSLGSYQGVSAASSYDFSSSFLGGGIGIGSGEGEGGNFDEINTKVNYETFRNWVEINFPQMANIVSTFIHLAFFSTGGEDSDTSNHHNKELFEKNVDAHGCDDNNEDDNDDDVRIMNLLMYAQGNRKMFRFPQLQQLVMANSFTQKNTLSRKIIATPPTSSILFETTTTAAQNKELESHNDKGVEGHFAFGMACMDSNLSGKWYRLYSTETDGFAFLNMQRALTGYTGPTVMIIRPTKANTFTSDNNTSSSPGLFGFYTANPWRESNKFYGTSDCFLFRADPIWNVYRPRCFVQGWKIDHTVDDSLSSPLRKKKLKENYMYFHSSTNHMGSGAGMVASGSGYRSMKSTKTGIMSGGTTDQPRFHISETFEQCIASSGSMMDMTFESGPLLPGQWDKYYNIDVLEVWGVGGEDIVRDATSAKDKNEAMKEAFRKNIQRVDRKQFLDDFRSGLFGSNKLFEHRLDDNIRHDFGADESAQDRCE